MDSKQMRLKYPHTVDRNAACTGCGAHWSKEGVNATGLVIVHAKNCPYLKEVEVDQMVANER